MRFLILGDIMGKIGRRAVAELVPKLRKEHAVDFCIANAENLAHGTGVTRITVEEILESGVDFLTGGNHIWDKPEVYDILQDAELREKLIRPYNYPPGTAGVGAKIVQTGKYKTLVINIMGQVAMRPTLDNPLYALDAALREFEGQEYDFSLIDLHADVTAEKNGFGIYADGRVTAVWGTHTHVQTADERILPKGTAYITDVGVTGFRDGVIGETGDNVVKSMLTGMPLKHSIPETGLAVLGAILLEVDEKSKKVKNIQRLREEIDIK